MKAKFKVGDPVVIVSSNQFGIVVAEGKLNRYETMNKTYVVKNSSHIEKMYSENELDYIEAKLNK